MLVAIFMASRLPRRDRSIEIADYVEAERDRGEDTKKQQRHAGF